MAADVIPAAGSRKSKTHFKRHREIVPGSDSNFTWEMQSNWRFAEMVKVDGSDVCHRRARHLAGASIAKEERKCWTNEST